MKLFQKIALGFAATGLAAAPIAAQSYAPVTAPVSGEAEELGGGIAPVFIVLALAGAGMAILLATDDDDDPISV